MHRAQGLAIDEGVRAATAKRPRVEITINLSGFILSATVDAIFADYLRREEARDAASRQQGRSWIKKFLGAAERERRAGR